MRNLYTACGCVVVLAACASVFGQSVVLPPAPAGVEVTREQGIEFVTVRAGGGGVPFGLPSDQTNFNLLGRGTVAGDFRIARTEVGAGQWVEFINTFSGQRVPDVLMPHLGEFARAGPQAWSVRQPDVAEPGYFGRSELIDGFEGGSMLPTRVTWRVAAIYCNWLHNGRSSDPQSLVSGAYDTRTWSTNLTGPITDALLPQPGARFMMPTLDQWMRAGFYDANRFGQGQGGWWQRVNASDELPVVGYPGQRDSQGRLSTTTYGIQGPNGEFDPFVEYVPLAAFTHAQSPWGLFDMIGGMTEWLNDQGPFGFDVPLQYRMTAGMDASYTLFPSYLPQALDYSSHVLGPYSYTEVTNGWDVGLRVVAIVPVPGMASAFACGAVSLGSRRRR